MLPLYNYPPHPNHTPWLPCAIEQSLQNWEPLAKPGLPPFTVNYLLIGTQHTTLRQQKSTVVVTKTIRPQSLQSRFSLYSKFSHCSQKYNLTFFTLTGKTLPELSLPPSRLTSHTLLPFSVAQLSWFSPTSGPLPSRLPVLGCPSPSLAFSRHSHLSLMTPHQSGLPWKLHNVTPSHTLNIILFYLHHGICYLFYWFCLFH